MFEQLPKNSILEISDIPKIIPKLAALAHLPFDIAQKTQTLVFEEEGSTLAVLTTNAFPQLYYQILDKLHAQGRKTQTRFTDENGFTAALQRYQQRAEALSEEEKTQHYRMYVSGAEAIALIKETYRTKETLSEGTFITELLRLTYQAGCSDLHFQSEELGVVMRVRKDGILQTVLVFSHQEFKKYLMKIKFMSGVKMNVEVIAQDGRFDLDIPQEGKTVKIDIRVSVMPSLRGESVVLRFLDGSKSLLSLDKLGCIPYHQEILKHHLQSNFGLILLTGPTGSGKTTTVYTMLNMLNTPDKKVITLEDPVEYELPGLEQSQINEAKGFTFEEGLKGILRHDPDIIMVGEIRSLESAEMAINAALTGHLVISTLHTNSAIEAITRLLNMGVKPYMLAPALQLIVGQRLVRKLRNKKEAKVPTERKNEVTKAAEHLFHATGDTFFEQAEHIYAPVVDESERGSGYDGRVGVYECFSVTAALKQAMIEGKSTNEILHMAEQQGYLTMREDGIGKVLRGETSLEEIERVL